MGTVTATVAPPFVARSLELGLVTYMEDHMPGWLSLMALAPLRGYFVASEDARHAEEQLPCVIVTSGGTEGDAYRSGDGVYESQWAIAVGCVVSARREVEARYLGQAYAGCIRECVARADSLGDLVSRTRWVDERYDLLEVIDRRTIFAARTSWLFTVPRAAWGAGPHPTDTWPLVTSTCEPQVESVEVIPEIQS